MSYGIVYLVTNNSNGKLYVGQTTQSVESRWRKHVSNSNHHRNRMPIAFAISKYGKESFSIKALEYCDNQAQLDKQELFWATTLDTFSPNGYNLKAGSGPGSMSDQTKKKIGKSNAGKKRTEDWLKRLSESHMGQKMPESTKLALQRANKDRVIPAKVRLAASIAMQGTFHLISPDGESVTIINMAKFCKENGYNKSRMSELCQGRRKAYRGWRLP